MNIVSLLINNLVFRKYTFLLEMTCPEIAACIPRKCLEYELPM